MDYNVIDPKRHEEIKLKIFGSGRFKLHKASYFKEFDLQDVQAFGLFNSLYQIPTAELIEFLKQWVIPQKTIENRFRQRIYW